MGKRIRIRINVVSLRRVRRVLFFYIFLVFTNILLLFYEIKIVGMTIEQSLAFRSVTVFTDLLEAILFLEYFKDLASLVLNFFHINVRAKWLLGGIKLALIGPNIYLLKLFLINTVLNEINIGIPAVSVNKIFLAYFVALISSFIWGALWIGFMEKMINQAFSRLSSKKTVNSP